MNHVCGRCLTTFSSTDILYKHIERCIKQQPTIISFSWKDHLKFEDHHMKISYLLECMQMSNVLINLKTTPKFDLNKFQLQ